MIWKLRRDFDVLVLHDLQDLQELGSLTTIWWHLSEAWDKGKQEFIQLATAYERE